MKAIIFETWKIRDSSMVDKHARADSNIDSKIKNIISNIISSFSLIARAQLGLSHVHRPDHKIHAYHISELNQ
jgi:hypothetical protein